MVTYSSNRRALDDIFTVAAAKPVTIGIQQENELGSDPKGGPGPRIEIAQHVFLPGEFRMLL